MKTEEIKRKKTGKFNMGQPQGLTCKCEPYSVGQQEYAKGKCLILALALKVRPIPKEAQKHLPTSTLGKGQCPRS